MGKIRFTPLNIVVALCITYAVYCFLGYDQTNPAISKTSKVAYAMALAIILFLADLLFRRFIAVNKWIWLIEGSFILLVFIMMMIAQNI